MRQIWNQYYDDAAGIVLVIDAADHRRLNEALSVAVAVLRSSRLQGTPLLILANKNDKVGAVDTHTLHCRLVDTLREDGVRDLPSVLASAPGSASAGAAAASPSSATHTELLGHSVVIASISALACDGVKEAIEAFVPHAREAAVKANAASSQSV